MLPRMAGHLSGDPRRPRAQDLPRAVPMESDLAALDDAKIIAAPDDARDWDAWRGQLRRWRDEARMRLAYDGERYGRPALAWTQRCFALCVAWLWDERLYDYARQTFTVDAFLDGDADLGGYDAVLLWHTYPLLGIDERDQFDFYRDVAQLQDVVRAFHRRDIRVLLEYHAWDRRAGAPLRDDVAEVARMAMATGADGIFLDSQREAPPLMRSQLDATGRPIALESESNIPLEGIADHEMSWAQWQADSPTPGVLRAKWFEQRHMLHQTRRWDRDRAPQLRTAWLNGTGMVVWENVFGSWVGWSAGDRTTLRAMRRVQRHFAQYFARGEWAPLADPVDPVLPSIFSSRFALGSSRLWTIVARDGHSFDGDVLSTEARDGERWFELVSGVELAPARRGQRALVRLPALARTFAAVLALPQSQLDDGLRAFLADQSGQMWGDEGALPSRVSRRMSPARAERSSSPVGMLRVAGGERSLPVRYRLRETGMYEPAPFANLWKPLPPLLHRVEVERRTVALSPFAISRTEVTNADYARFLDETAYQPRDSGRFLAHWVGGRPPLGAEGEPARYVDLDDARAYATWAGLRLPTEFEWQVAAGEPGFARAAPLVWNWTESEHTDGRTRFVILKGGSHVRAEGSEWYVDGGWQPPEVSLKLLRAGPAIERSSAIGFRCAADLAGPAR
jgi:sulfatase-modifying factor enzyme 1